MAPSMDLADKRLFLMKGCALLSRELVLNDGFSRMHPERIAGTLSFMLDDLREVDLAIRLGGLREVRVGADRRGNELHNQIMYSNGCTWKDVHTLGPVHRRGGGVAYEEHAESNSASGDSGCDIPVFPKAAEHGLYSLLLLFMDTVKTTLEQYAPEDRSTWINAFKEPNPEEQRHDFDKVLPNWEGINKLQTSEDLIFIMEMFHGELFRGLHTIMAIFHDETKHIFEVVHYELRILYCTYIVTVILLFYFLLFKRTLRYSYEEARKAKAFVRAMPIHTMTKEELDTVKRYFIPEEMWEQED
eukprot:CAMPEP_0184302136 /NCGR_PEP_ID=MMETSP1049-20130417/12183_1 /TAXON_ID=77928 /ORGANISM="Proteomonas sulcata, Strain CCMP704" /LENGTH=300 /DNA_ID=CAMNT_0026613341 /DNA_START=17 /DNA_END=919 /DNA_ORIENTATION=-